MALKNFVFDLSSVTVSGADTIAAGSKVSVSGTEVEVASIASAQSYMNVGSFGKITAVNTGIVDFKLNAGVEAGVYKVETPASGASIRSFDGSAVTAGMNVDLSVVSVDSGVVKTGSGDDVISVFGSTAADVNVYGGKGADKFILDDSTVKSVVSDYSYAEGDVVSVSALGTYKLTNAGEFSDGTATHTTVKAAGADGLYKVKLQAGTDMYDVVTAQTGEDVSVTLSQDAGIVDVSGAKSAVVDLGQGNDSITADNTALTLKVGRADGDNSLATSLGADDTLALLNGDLGLVSVDGSGNLTFGGTTIKSAVDASGQSAFKVSFDDGKTTGVAAAGKDKITVEAGDLPDFYVGIGSDVTVSVETATTVDAVIDLSDNSKISGDVNFIDATNVNGNATLKGRADVATTIKTGVVAAGKTQEIYTGTGKDSVDLASSAGVFKVHLSNAEDNADTVTGFDLANDILVLDDVAKLAVDTFSVNSSDLLLGTSKASIAGAAATVAGGINVQLSGADKAIKVALAQTSSIITADQDTDVVLNVKDTVPAGVSYKGATFANAFEVNLNDTAKYIGTFVSVDASDAGQAALVLGKDGVDNNVTIGGGSVVWGGANSNDTLTINRSNDVDGGSIVWTGAAGGKDTLANYDGTKDVIYSYDRATWTNEAIKSDVTFDSVTSAVIINSADGSTLNIGAYAGKNLLLMGNQMEVSKVAIASATSVAAYASDVNVYLSAKANTTVEVNNSAVAEGDSAVIDLSANNLMGAGKTYGDNITNIDASESAGSFLLVGANVSGSTIKGGQTMNVLYGGGNADQTMMGVDAAADLFWFGSTDGHDTIGNFDAKRDVVYLWNATNIADVTVSSISKTAATVVFNATGSTLNISGNNIADTTFMVRDGADGYNYYTYDAENKAFVKKQ